MNRLTSKRSVILSLVAIVLLWTLFYFATHKIVVVKNPGQNSASGTLVSNKKESKLNIPAGGEKRLFLASGDYRLAVSKDGTNEKSTYYLDLSGFGTKTIDLNFRNQKQSISLGDSELGCVLYGKKSQQVTYRQCEGPSSDKNTLVLTKDGEAYNKVSRPHNPEFLDWYLATPYLEGLLEVTMDDSELQKITKLNFSNNLLAEAKAPYKFDDIKVANIFSDKNQQDNKRFAVLRENMSISSFKDIDDTNPTSIDLSSELTNGSARTVIGTISGDKLYIFDGDSFYASQGDEPAESRGNTKTDQKLLVVDLLSGQTSSVALADGILVGSISSSESGEVALSVISSREKDGHSVLFIKNGEVSSSPLVDDMAPGQACWVGNNLYYITKQGEVVNYDKTSSIAHLVYSNGASSLSNLDCVFGSLYLTINDSGSSESAQIKHIMIDLQTDFPDDPEATRAEDIFPIIGDQENNIALGDSFKSRIKILYRDFDDQSFTHPCTVTDQEHSDLIKYLNGLGIDSKAYSFSVSYDCHSATQ